jgi:phospholipid/cholesterol/gamma-HCH transport system ATP-binding protein
MSGILALTHTPTKSPGRWSAFKTALASVHHWWSGGKPPAIIPRSPPDTEIATHGLTKSYATKHVLCGIELVIPRGQMVAIIGGSGCGKSTLLKLLTARESPDRGTVQLANHELTGAPLVDLATLDRSKLNSLRRHWAVVFQGNAPFSGTVFDNLALVLREVQHLDEATIRHRATLAMQAVALDPVVDIKLNVDALSGGMAKRVAIARAIALDPAVVFYDEPTSGLDPTLTSEIHELLLAVHVRPTANNTRRTSVIVTHDRDLLRRLEPRVVMLHEGLIYFDGSHDQLLKSESPIIRPYYKEMPVIHAADMINREFRRKHSPDIIPRPPFPQSPVRSTSPAPPG